MDRIIVNDKVYYGSLIHEGKVNDINISIYVLNFISEKYLVLRKCKEVKSFIVMGIDKINALIELLNKKSLEINVIDKEVNRRLKELKSQAYIKNLKKTDEGLLNKLISDYYSNNYHLFAVILGLRKKDLIKAT